MVEEDGRRERVDAGNRSTQRSIDAVPAKARQLRFVTSPDGFRFRLRFCQTKRLPFPSGVRDGQHPGQRLSAQMRRQ
ncbi:hypothetical protein C0Z19_14750 [Trinickia soli]|uniref:Uncharacterized protein n=1 Tax=Trinickia soli TaxID=380675 RepID=A0A2N7W3W0_9BURK|nr:hypothetical protein C0Z19_14750 [Trinickia soli]